MTLREYIKLHKEDWEITVCDKDYDIEVYFYADNKTKWDKALLRLAEKLEIVEIAESNAVVVNMSEVFEKNIPYLEDLFVRCNIDAIMDDIENIIAGYVSEEWFVKFVDRLEV